MTHARHPANAPGAFYGTGGCMACGAPEHEAPDLLAELTDQQLETYFVRQPSTPAEIEQASRALEVCCVNALRYEGTDPGILARLGNRSIYCDAPMPQPVDPGRSLPQVRHFRVLWWALAFCLLPVVAYCLYRAAGWLPSPAVWAASGVNHGPWHESLVGLFVALGLGLSGLLTAIGLVSCFLAVGQSPPIARRALALTLAAALCAGAYLEWIFWTID